MGEFPYGDIKQQLSTIWENDIAAKIVAAFLYCLPVPEAYIAGFLEFLAHYAKGHKAFLFGENYRLGKWYFFPLCFILKLTFFSTILLICSLTFLVRTLLDRKKRPQQISNYLKIFFTPVILLLLTLNASVNDGIRNAVWLLPFLFLTVPFMFAHTKEKRKKSILRLTTTAIFYNLIVLFLYYPWYIPFVDPVFGGPSQARVYLGGSNIDMGESLYHTEDYLQQKHVKRVISFYIGHAIPRDDSKIKWVGPEALNGPLNSEDRIILSESAQAYDRETYDWIYRRFEKEAEIGYTISIFRAIPR